MKKKTKADVIQGSVAQTAFNKTQEKMSAELKQIRENIDFGPTKIYPDGRSGQYTCKCVKCGARFMGDKRDYFCEKCDKDVEIERAKTVLTFNEVENEALRLTVEELASCLERLLQLHFTDTMTGPGQPQFDSSLALRRAASFRKKPLSFRSPG